MRNSNRQYRDSQSKSTGMQTTFQFPSEQKTPSVIYANELSLSYRRSVALSDPQYHKLNNSRRISEFLRTIWDTKDLAVREAFYLICLSKSMDLVGFYKISEGGLDSVIVDVRLLFSMALLCRSTAIIVAHNHPSGTPKPSTADREITKRIANVGNLLDIKLADHIILTETTYYSFSDEGLL